MRKLTPQQIIADRRYVEAARATLAEGPIEGDRVVALVEIAGALFSHIDATSPRDLSSVGELDRLPVRSVIRTPQDYTLEKLSNGWYQGGLESAYYPNDKWLPAVLLYSPAQEG